ncbi:MAG: hypothetical protein AAB308_01950 [Nitrospirota bacterium]
MAWPVWGLFFSASNVGELKFLAVPEEVETPCDELGLTLVAVPEEVDTPCDELGLTLVAVPEEVDTPCDELELPLLGLSFFTLTSSAEA